ncbi:hypothetical protein [Flaviflexus equikiangi]|uniref:hypothetical protein n=1 Tax=Flaviflexus equikiangi TaxID=2758573 RepID=UPI0015F4B107|nr:hypothetical protein [Flaviflexus equikiangi]
MEFTPNYTYIPFGIDIDGVDQIESIFGEDLWRRVSKWTDKFNESFREMEGVFGSEKLRAEIDREYVALAMEMQEKLPEGERLTIDMWW